MSVQSIPANLSTTQNSANASLTSFRRNNVSFKKKKETLDDTEPKRRVSSRIGTALSSTIIPGLGQLAKGEPGKAAAFFFGIMIGSPIVGVLAKAWRPAGSIAGIGVLGVHIWNIVDAARGEVKTKQD